MGAVIFTGSELGVLVYKAKQEEDIIETNPSPYYTCLYQNKRLC